LLWWGEITAADDFYQTQVGVNSTMNAAEVIKLFQLEPLAVEGGFFKLTYRSSFIAEGASRVCCSSIYFALTAESPINFFHKLQSDIVHYFIRGCPIKYTVISPTGNCTTTVLGHSLKAGHQQHCIVLRNHWKMAELLQNSEEQDFGLISETVCPGFEYEDRTMATLEDIQKIRSADWNSLAHGITASSSSS